MLNRLHQQLLDTGNQVLSFEWLGDKLVTATLEALVLFFRASQRCESYDGNGMGLRVLTDQPGGLKAIDLWHDHVHQDEIGQLSNGHIHGLLPVHGGNDFIPRLENQLQDLVHNRVVFRYKDFLFHMERYL